MIFLRSLPFVVFMHSEQGLDFPSPACAVFAVTALWWVARRKYMSILTLIVECRPVIGRLWTCGIVRMRASASPKSLLLTFLGSQLCFKHQIVFAFTLAVSRQ